MLAALDAVAQVDASVVSGGPAHGCRAIDVRVAGGIDLRILPDRGLDLGGAWFGGVPLAWRSAVGGAARRSTRPSGADWLDGFGGGLRRDVRAAQRRRRVGGARPARPDLARARASAVTTDRALAGGEAVVTIRGVARRGLRARPAPAARAARSRRGRARGDVDRPTASRTSARRPSPRRCSTTSTSARRCSVRRRAWRSRARARSRATTRPRARAGSAGPPQAGRWPARRRSCSSTPTRTRAGG